MKRRLIIEHPYIDGVANAYSEATPADIAKAHPKCETCKHLQTYRDNGRTHIRCRRCVSFGVGLDAKLIPATDYCRHHSILEKQS